MDRPSARADNASASRNAVGSLNNTSGHDANGSTSLGSDLPNTIGGYRVVRLLGEGGMGRVLEAEDAQLRRRIAVKVMRPELATNDQSRQRFLREARAVAALQHDHVVSIYQVGEEGGVPFLAMPLLVGESLQCRLAREGTLPSDEVARIGREAAEGLAAAHAAGLVHRDVKPGNLWLEAPTGRVKVLDFGLARAADGSADLTGGRVVGTPAYMSPEQIEGQPVDARSDLFSLGCVLYQAATGKKPFQGKSTLALLRAVAERQPPAPREVHPAVPEALSALILHLLAKRPEGRPPSARAVVEALTTGSPQPPSVPHAAPPRPSRTSGLVAAGAVLLLAVGGAAAWRWPWETEATHPSPGNASPVAAAPNATRITSFRVSLFTVSEKETLPAGVVSTAPVLPEEVPLTSLPFGARVQIEAKFSAPAYAYLIAFNADGGPPQLLWPVNAEKRSDKGVKPPQVDRLVYPGRRGPNGGPMLFRLDDEPRGGLQAVAVVASASELPAFEEWAKGRGPWPWQRQAGWKGAWVADREGVYPVLPGGGAVRGNEEVVEVPPLRELARALEAGGEVVEVLAIPVRPKENNP